MPSPNVYQTFHNDSILLLRSVSTRREEVDEFWRQVSQYAERRRALQQPVFYLHSSARIGLTQYSRATADRHIFELRHMQGYGAYVFGKDPLTLVIKSYVIGYVKRNLTRVEIQEFPTEGEALTWLEDRYQTHLSQP